MSRSAVPLLLVAALASACAPAPKPPYPLAFTLDVRSPRVLTSGEEIAVPAAIVNAGTRAWDPASMHFSYHWLWLVPRELVRRSRTVPYHDGIRTELGERAVPPGSRVSLQGRLLAPDVPGVYWLQWDMVEEGVQWFAQDAPRQPRSLVVVVPPLAWALAPLPLAAAIAGLLATRRMGRRAPRAPRFAAVADVVWCAASLAAKPLIVEHDALLEPTAVSYWLVLAVAVLVPLLALAILPQRIRPWVLLAAGIFASLLLLADVVYYRFFGDMLSTPALLAARQTGRVWGSVGALVTPDLVFLILDWPLALWLAARTMRVRAWPALESRAIAGAGAFAAFAVSGLLLAAPRALAAAPLDQMFRARSIVEQLGPFGYHAYDAWTFARASWLRRPATDAQVRGAAEWFRARAPLRAGGATFGAARGRNLIVVQVESLQDFAVDFRAGGQEVMPHLRRWTADAMRFTNVTDETSEGRTSDAELTTLTSLLPLDHGAAAFRFPRNHYVALPAVLAEGGYSTLSAVPFEAGFWNRRVMHPAYGFQQSLFEPDFTLTEQIGWGLNDRDFLQQMIPRLERLRQPFAAWMITLSLHHPFASFPDAHKVLTLGALEGSSFGNYLHTMRFFDQALEDFRAALARDGLLDRSVLVVFGDHDAGFAREAALARTIGIAGDDVAWTLNDRVPLFVRVGGAPAGDERFTGARAIPAGQTDLAPTILSLLGVDAAPLPYVGRNLLGAPGEGPVPRPYGDWLDARHLFVAHGAVPLCYDLRTRVAAPPADCAAPTSAARRAREISRLVVVDDLQAPLRNAVQ